MMNQDHIHSTAQYYPASGLLHGSVAHVMGTCLDVLIIGKEEDEVLNIWKEIFKEICRLDSMMSRFDPESELYRLNQQAHESPFSIQDELWSVLVACRNFYRLSEGYFDISLGYWDKISWNDTKHTIFFTDPGCSLDLGGYGKGYALEKVKPIFAKSGIRHALVNFGNSSVLGVGTHLYGDSWEIGVVDPSSQQPVGSVKLKDNALSISGNSPRNPAHIVDPHNRIHYKGNRLVAVTAANAAEAEVLTTALLVAPGNLQHKIAGRFTLDSLDVYDL